MAKLVWSNRFRCESYDGRGNLTSSVGQDGKTYTYTPANLLSSVTHDGVQGTPVSSMTWDGDSNRVSFSSSTGGTWQYVYDRTAGIPAVIEEVTPSGSVYYLREPNGALIAWVSTNGIHYYHFDALGSTRLLTDDTGAVTDEYSYDAWGNVISHDQYAGSTAQPYQFVGRLGYYTHWRDENLDLLQLGVRFYDPEIGRFTQKDPIRDGLNWYAYVDGKPTLFVDPTGLKVPRDDVNFTLCEAKIKNKKYPGNVVTVATYCRNETELDVQGFAKCLSKKCWPTIAKAGVCLWKYKNLPPYVAGAHLLDCMVDASIGQDYADVDCYYSNLNTKRVKWVIKECTIIIGDQPYSFINIPRPPAGQGWKLCD